jgi:hypothetical protein
MLLAALPSLSKPLIMDEMEFPAVARAIRQTGLPVYYRGDLYPNNVGLWHPPLYILSYALWQSLVGESVVTDRLFGLVMAWGAIVLLGVFTARRWTWPDRNRQEIMWKSLALFTGLCVAGTSPLLVQGSILPDIDTQVLPLLTLAFFLLMFELRRVKLRPTFYWLVFIVAMVFMLFTKLTTPLLLIPAFAAFEIGSEFSNGQQALRIRMRKTTGRTPAGASRTYRSLWISFNIAWRRLIGKALFPLLVGLLSMVVMTALWFVLARVWRVDFSMPFTWLTVSTNNPANFGATAIDSILAIIRSAPKHFIYLFQWFGIPAFFVIFFLIAREIFSPSNGFLMRQERMALQTFLVLLTLMYIVLRPAPFEFPKYYPPLILPLCLLITDWLFAVLKKGDFGLVAPIMLCETVFYLAYVFFTQQATTSDFIHAIQYEWPKMPFFLRWMLWPLIIIVVVNGLLAVCCRKRAWTFVLAGVVAVLLGWQTSAILQQTQVTYSTTYYYGEESLAKVTAYLRENLPDNVIVIAPKDVGALIQDRWHYIELLYDPRPHLDHSGVKYFVMRTNDGWGNTIRDSPEIMRAIEKQYELLATIGNFVVMKRRS